MRYKPSKFNYMVYNENKELLLYNSNIGTSSFGKIRSKNANMIYELLSKDHVKIDDKNKMIVDCMAEKGFLVTNETDEDANCYNSYLKLINNNYLHLVINPTDKCNFRCVYCYENYKNDRMSNETQTSIIEFVKREIYKFEGLKVSWFGGEPLLELDIIENLSRKFIEICSKLKRSYMATITTNGYLLNKETFEKLLKLKILHYQITLDGLKLTHDIQRPLKNGNGTFDTIVNNLLDIKKYCNHSFYNISLRTNFTRTLFLYRNEYFKFLEENFMDNKHFDVLIRVASNWGGDRVKNISENLIDNQNYIKDILSSMKKYNLRFQLMKDMFNPGRNFCYASQINSYSINSNGEISKCTTDLDNSRFAKIGYIAKNKIIIDHDKEIKWITNYNDTCSCFFKPVCMGIKCPKANYESKFISNSDKKYVIPCPFEKQNIKELFLLFDHAGEFPFIEV